MVSGATGLMPAGLGHVKLPVRDLAVSRRFYAEARAPLGFELVYEGPKSLGFGLAPPSCSRRS